MCCQITCRGAMLLLTAIFIVVSPVSATNFVSDAYNTQRVLQIGLLCSLGVFSTYRFVSLAFAASTSPEQIIHTGGTDAPYVVTSSGNWIAGIPYIQILLIIIAILGLCSVLRSQYIVEGMMEWSSWVLLACVSYWVAQFISFPALFEMGMRILVTSMVCSLLLYFILFCVNYIAVANVLDQLSTSILWGVCV